MTDANRDDLQASMTVINRNREKLHMAMTADGDSQDEAMAGSLGLALRVDAKEELDATVSGTADWSGTEEDLRASMTVINKQRERLHMAMTADGDSQDEAMAGSLGLLVRTDADDKLDGHLSGAVDWSGMTDANRDDLQASMTVINRNREKLHMAMTADGDSQDEAMAGSLGLALRVDAKEELDATVSGTADWSGTEEDLRASMTVINKQRERLHMAMTADGDSQDEAMAGSLGLALRVDAKEELDATVSGTADWSGTEEDLRASMTVINKQRERLHMAMTADGDSQDEAMAGSLGLLVRTDADDKLDGHLSGAVDWSGMTDANRDDLQASMTVINRNREKLHMAMTADGDSQDEAMAGSLGLLVRTDADDKVDGHLSGGVDWSGMTDANRDDLQASMTVINRNREKLHMAMTADGNSRFRDGTAPWAARRLDNEEEIDGLVSGGLDWSGTTHPSRDDIRVRMAVSNKDRERFRMAMTADGDSQDEAVSGSLGLALFAEADEKFDGRVSGGLDWSDALEATMTVSNRNREKLHMAMTADGNSRFRERDGSLGLLVRVDNEEEIDGLVSGGLDWSGTTHPSRDDIRVRMAVSNKDRERFRMAMTADGDSQDEAVSGSLGLALFAEADEKFDGRVSGGLDWSDALEATMTVSNRNREKLHMAMTADGNSRFRERDGSLGLLVRLDNEEEIDGLVSGGLDWSGTTHPSRDDIRVRMAVSNKDRERFRMAMTADGDSQDEAVSGSLGLALFAEADEKFDGRVSGGLDWSDALEATMTVSNRNREKLHMAMTADGNSRFRERDGSLGLLVRLDNEEEIDGLVSGGLDWSGTTHSSRDDIRVRMAVGNKDRERFRMAMTADGDSQDEAVSGSLGLALFAEADEKFDGRVSGGLDWSDALEATMTVSNRNREKLHMAMTADGNSRFRERDGSLGLLVRLDNEEEIDGLVSGGLDWSGTTHSSRDDIRVRMAVSNKDRERFRMAMTADGDSQDEAVSGSLGLALFAEADEKFDGRVSGGLDWSDALEAT